MVRQAVLKTVAGKTVAGSNPVPSARSPYTTLEIPEYLRGKVEWLGQKAQTDQARRPNKERNLYDICISNI